MSRTSSPPILESAKGECWFQSFVKRMAFHRNSFRQLINCWSCSGTRRRSTGKQNFHLSWTWLLRGGKWPAFCHADSSFEMYFYSDPYPLLGVSIVTLHLRFSTNLEAAKCWRKLMHRQKTTESCLTTHYSINAYVRHLTDRTIVNVQVSSSLFIRAMRIGGR